MARGRQYQGMPNALPTAWLRREPQHRGSADGELARLGRSPVRSRRADVDHGLTGKGQWHYDACVRVPLTIVGPGLERGLVCSDLVQLEDIMPTVLEMAKLPQPQPPVLGPYLKVPPDALPGRSLLDLCRGADVADWRESVHIQSFNNLDYCTPHQWARTVRTRDWRYTAYQQGNGEQLWGSIAGPGMAIRAQLGWCRAGYGRRCARHRRHQLRGRAACRRRSARGSNEPPGRAPNTQRPTPG